MGFNPHQPRKRTPWDYVFVVAGLAACLAVVLWAALG